MKPIAFRLSFFFILAILQLSIINNVAHSSSLIVPVLLSAVVAFALIHGFARTWPWAIVSGVLIDTLLFGRIGMSSGIFVLATAGFGFATKQWIFGHGWGKLVFFGCLVWVFSLFVRFVVVFFTFTGMDISFHFYAMLPTIFSGVFPIISSLIVSILTFSVIFLILVPFERYVGFFERSTVGRR